MRRRIPAVVLVVLLGLTTAASCSLANREGPDVTCGQLQNGAVNACKAGILGSCVGGSVTYKVCDDGSACEASWQKQGQYRCAETDPPPGVATTACSSSNQCSGATPQCYAAGGFCVQCNSDANCPASTPRCDTTHTCVGTTPVVCGFAYKRTTCSSCIQKSCCAASQTCAAATDCKSCMSRPAQASPCVPGMVATYDDLTSCIQTSCSSSC